MALYALAAAFLFGLLRWPVWTVPLLIVAWVIASLGIGAGWDPNVWKPFNNPIFVDLVLKLLLVSTIACTIGYVIGRLIAWGWRRLRRA